MYTRFYDNTLKTKFIKNIVAKTNVPFISTWKPGDFAIRGMLYLTKDAIWKCQHTGFPNSIDDVCNIHNVNLYTKGASGEYSQVNGQDNMQPRFFTRVSPYVFGKEYYNITGHFMSNILGYDSTTHFYLGLYLRVLRDLYDLDLMPFYNCYANEVVTDVDFSFNKNSEHTSSLEVEIVSRKRAKDSLYKILSVPVKFGKTYMISLDNALPTEVACVIYGLKGLLVDLTKNLNDERYANSQVGPSTYRKFLRTQFKSPILYKTPSWLLVYNNYMALKLSNGKYDIDYQYNLDNDSSFISDQAYDLALGQFEKNLRLLIKIPKTNKSSVVVIEGDYPVMTCSASEDFAERLNNVTWSNKYLENFTVNSKTVKGEWIRPEVIENFNMLKIFEPYKREEAEAALEYFTEHELAGAKLQLRSDRFGIYIDKSVNSQLYEVQDNTELKVLFLFNVKKVYGMNDTFDISACWSVKKTGDSQFTKYPIINEFLVTYGVMSENLPEMVTVEFDTLPNDKRVIRIISDLFKTPFVIPNEFKQIYRDPGSIFETYNQLPMLENHILITRAPINISREDYKKHSEPLLSPLGLLLLSDGNTYAFSDRLIEFLTLHAINHLDSFGKNILRVLEYSRSEINYIKNGSRYNDTLISGVWDKNFLRYLFDLVKKSKVVDITKVDLTGYVDKDTEQIITRGLLETLKK